MTSTPLTRRLHRTPFEYWMKRKVFSWWQDCLRGVCLSCRNFHILSMGNRLSRDKNSPHMFHCGGKTRLAAKSPHAMKEQPHAHRHVLETSIFLFFVTGSYCNVPVVRWNLDLDYLRPSNNLYVLAQVRFGRIQLTSGCVWLLLISPYPSKYSEH